MGRLTNSAFTFFVLLVLGAAFWSALSMPSQAALFPKAVAGVAFSLCLIQLLLEVRAARHAVGAGIGESDGVIDLPEVEGVSVRDMYLRAGRTTVWFTGFVAMVVLVGFMIASPVFVVLYVSIRHKSKWYGALIAALIVFIFQWGMFYKALGRPWFIPMFPEPQAWLLSFL